MKLNLGCGNKKVEGFIGVDIKDADVVADIRKLPYEDNSVDEIMAIHVCEHFYKHEILSVLEEWRRVLKHDGIMVLELPCLDKVLRHFEMGSPNNMTMWALYGQPETHIDGEPALHKWCWSMQNFEWLLEKVGMRNITSERPRFHQPSRDMRFVCQK
jgi:ubiquinone/menaquinone biosynthesis C-methylase UbiE